MQLTAPLGATGRTSGATPRAPQLIRSVGQRGSPARILRRLL